MQKEKCINLQLKSIQLFDKQKPHNYNIPNLTNNKLSKPQQQIIINHPHLHQNNNQLTKGNFQQIQPIKFPFYNLSLFKTNQFNNTSMIQSIDVDYPQMVQSQILTKSKYIQSQTKYTASKGKFCQKNGITNHNTVLQYSLSNCEQSKIPVNLNGFSQNKYFTNVFLDSVGRNDLNHVQTPQKFINQRTNIQQNLINNKQIFSNKQQNQHLQSVDQKNKYFIQNEGNCFKKKNSPNFDTQIYQLSDEKPKVKNEQISQVKTRLDMLINRYPVKLLNQMSNHKQQLSNRKNQPPNKESYKTQKIRSNSSDNKNSNYQFKLKKNQHLQKVKNQNNQIISKQKHKVNVQIEQNRHMNNVVRLQNQKQNNYTNYIHDFQDVNTSQQKLEFQNDNKQKQQNPDLIINQQNNKQSLKKGLFNLSSHKFKQVVQSQHMQNQPSIHFQNVNFKHSFNIQNDQQYKNKIQKLLNQVNQQQTLIVQYEKMIFKLESQNLRLIQIIQSHQHYVPEEQSNNKKFKQHFTNQNSKNDQNKNQQFAINKGYFHNNKNSQLDDTIHKFQRQDIDISQQENRSLSINNQIPIIQSLKKNNKKKTNNKVSQNTDNNFNNKNIINNLTHKIQILQAQKKQFLNKIDWLNGVIEQMMNMGSRIKNDKSIIFDPLSQYSNKSRFNHSRQFSGGEIKKQQKQLQTSFIQDPVTLLNKSQNHYKTMYEKSLQNQQNLIQQIKNIQNLQQLYAGQFKMILKQIGEIKQNRMYYKMLKREIKIKNCQMDQRLGRRSLQRGPKLYKDFKQQQSGLEKNTNNKLTHKSQDAKILLKSPKSCKRNPHMKQSNQRQQTDKSKKIFQNHLIYQLKNQNQRLRQKYQQLKHNYHYVLQKKQINPEIILPAPIQKYSINKGHQISNNQRKNNNLDIFVRNDEYFSIQNNKNKHINYYVMKNKNNGQVLRPSSYGQFHRQKQKNTDYQNIYQARQKQLKNKYSISQFDQHNKKDTKIKQDYLKSQYSKNSPLNELKKDEYIKSMNMGYRNVLKTQKNYTPRSQNKDKSIKIKIKNKKSTIQQDKYMEQQRSSEIREQGPIENKQIVYRYNNFIKSLKQRFGISSTLIGKQLVMN